MLGSPCSPCCQSCTLPSEIAVRLTWSYANAAGYRWAAEDVAPYGTGYGACNNTIMPPYQTPSALFSGTPYGAGDMTLTSQGTTGGGYIPYSYNAAFRLNGCCNPDDLAAWIARVPTWASDNPQWKRLGVSVTVKYSAILIFYPKAYVSLSKPFSEVAAIIAARGDTFPSEPCGVVDVSSVLMYVHAKYENGQCALYRTDFAIKGSASYSGVQYPEQNPPWPGDRRVRLVAYGVQAGRVWFSSPIELQVGGSTNSQSIGIGSYMYTAGANQLTTL